MNKTSTAKKIQNYQPKPLSRRCRVCKHFESDIEENQWGYTVEKRLRCSIGGFAVTPNAICDLFEIKK